MKNFWVVLLVLFLAVTTTQQLEAQVYSTSAGGHWGTTTTWIGDTVPGALDSVVIQGPITLSNLFVNIQDLTVLESGSISDGWNSKITASGDVVIDGDVDLASSNGFYIYGDLSVNGFCYTAIRFVGTGDHNLFTSPLSSLSPYTYFNALESRIIAASDVYIHGEGFATIVAQEIDLSGGYDLYLMKARVGSSSDGVRTIITGAGNSLYMNDGGVTYPDQYFYSYCDLHDVTLEGNSYLSTGVAFYGEVINGDSLYTSVGPGGYTVEVEGNFTNNGVLQSDLKFNIHNNLTNNGFFQAQTLNFLGTSDHELTTLNENRITLSGDITAMESRILAMSDLYLDCENLFVNDLDLSNGYDLHALKTRIGSSYLTGLYDMRTKITGGGQSIYVEEDPYISQYYFQACDLEDVIFRGATPISHGVVLRGEVVNEDSLFGAVGNGDWAVEVEGNFTNNGVVKSYLTFNFQNNFTNNGSFQADELHFTGAGDHYFQTLGTNPVVVNDKILAMEGSVIASSDLYLSSINGMDLFMRELDLSNGYDLHTVKTRIGSAYHTDLYGFDTKVIGGGNAIYSETTLYTNQYFFQSCELHDITFYGDTPFNTGVSLFGTVINEDSLFAYSTGGNYTVDVIGDFYNNGSINSNFNFVFQGDLFNDGPLSYASAAFAGFSDQKIVLFNELPLPGLVSINSNLPSEVTTYQWVENGVVLQNDQGPLLHRPEGLSTASTVYYCRGSLSDSDTLSRRIFVGTEMPPANFPPSAFNLLGPEDGEEVATLLPLLDWDAALDPDPIEVLNYTLYLDTPEPGVQAIDLDTATSYQFMEPLLDNTAYYWYVIVNDLAGETATNNGGLTSFIVNTENDLPSEFELLMPANASVLLEMPTLTWAEANDSDVNGYIAEYLVYISIDSSFAETIPVSVDMPLLTPEIMFEEDIRYYWQVIAVDNAGGQRQSARWSFRINLLNTPPGAFSLLMPGEAAQTDLLPTFIWSASEDVDLNDSVRYVLSFGSSIQDLVNVETDGTTQYTVLSPLADNTIYVWQVTSIDMAGATFTTDFATFVVNQMNDGPSIVDIITPDSVQVLTLTPEMYWTVAQDPDPNDHIYYELQWWGGDVFFDSMLVDTNAVVLPRQLQDNTQYHWQVLAMDESDGISHSAQATFWTDLFPEAPVSFSLLEPTDQATGLTPTPSFLWEVSTDPDPNDFVLYTIQISRDSSFSDLAREFTGLYHNGISLETINQLDDNTEYWWKVIAIDSDALTTESEVFKLTVGTVTVGITEQIPVKYVLDQNYPNPFNPSTTFRYGVPESSTVSLVIYDVKGHVVKTFAAEHLSAGYYEKTWNGIGDSGEMLSTGVYFTRFQSPTFTKTIKMLFLK